MNLLKKLFIKPIVMDFYTNRLDVYNLSKPAKASKFFPEWWKVLPNTLDEDSMRPNSSMKRCIGFTNLYAEGFMLPMWSDLRVQVGPIGSDYHSWLYADSMSSAITHAQNQRGTYLPESHYQHLKLSCPWVGVCKEDVSWAVFGATWNFDKPEDIIIPAGVVDYKYQTTLNFNVFFPRGEQSKFVDIKHGQPLFHIVPMSERPVVCNYHLVSAEEMETHMPKPVWFTNAYKNTKTAANGKCPF